MSAGTLAAWIECSSTGDGRFHARRYLPTTEHHVQSTCELWIEISTTIHGTAGSVFAPVAFTSWGSVVSAPDSLEVALVGAT